MPIWIVWITAVQAASTVGKEQVAEDIASGMPWSLQGELGDDAERAFGAHEEAGEVVAGGGFLRAAGGADHATVGEDGFEGEDVVLHRAVADGVGARGAGGRHAAERGVGAGVDGEEQTLIAQVFVELLAGDAGLDGAVEVLRVDREDAVHAHQVERDAARGRVDVAFERGAGAVGDHGHPVVGADADDVGDLGGGVGEGHGVGGLGRDPGGGVAVLVADRLPGLEPVAEALAQDRGDGRDGGGVARQRGGEGHGGLRSGPRSGLSPDGGRGARGATRPGGSACGRARGGRRGGRGRA